MVDRITKAQIAKIWALAREIGLTRETLYLLVPQGSISTLNRREASELIGRLSGRPNRCGHRRRPRNYDHVFARGRPRTRAPTAAAATPEQWDFIYYLFGRLGWVSAPRRVQGFLRKFAGVSTVEEIADRKRASAIIEALKAMCRRRQKAGATRGEASVSVQNGPRNV